MARKKSTKSTLLLPQDEYLETKILELEDFLASDNGKRNGAAYVAATRLAANLRGELEAIRNPKGAEPENPAADLSDHDLVTGICEAVAGWPDEALDRLESALLLRRTGRPQLKVVES